MIDTAQIITVAGANQNFSRATRIADEKGNRLGYPLISNHAFVDGSKRIGMYVMLTFLEVNGIHMDCTNEEVASVGLAVAYGSMSYEELLAWVRDHASF